MLTVQQKPSTGLQGAGVGIVGHVPIQRPSSLTGGTGMVSTLPTATSLHRASTAPAGGAPCSARITGPQPVDVSQISSINSNFIGTGHGQAPDPAVVDSPTSTSTSTSTCSATGRLQPTHQTTTTTASISTTTTTTASSSTSVYESISYLSLTQRSPNASSSPLKKPQNVRLKNVSFLLFILFRYVLYFFFLIFFICLFLTSCLLII